MAKKIKRNIACINQREFLAVATTDTKGQSLLYPSTQQKFGNPAFPS
jgi:hypothetical protein